MSPTVTWPVSPPRPRSARSRPSSSSACARSIPELEDLNYATETYDAIMISALAVLQAGTDGIAHAEADQRHHPRRRDVHHVRRLCRAHRGRHRHRLRRHLRPADVRRQRRADRGELRQAGHGRQQPHRHQPDRVHHGRRPARTRRPADARRGQPRGRRRADVRHPAPADRVVGLPRPARVRRVQPGDPGDQRQRWRPRRRRRRHRG